MREGRKEKKGRKKKRSNAAEPLAVSLEFSRDSEKRLLAPLLFVSRRSRIYLNPPFFSGNTNLLELSAELLGDDGADVGEDLLLNFENKKKSFDDVRSSATLFSSLVCGRRFVLSLVILSP